MRLNTIAAGAALTLALTLTACSAPASDVPATTAPPTPDVAATTAPATSTPPTATPSAEGGEQEAMTTTVHFTAGDVVVEVTVDQDTPTTRSFLAMLPMTLEFSDYGGKEKLATPTGEWDFTDAEGLNPQRGDLFSYMPWGNLGFFYNTDGNTFDNSLTKIGETDDLDQIELLDGRQVTITVAG